MTCPGSGGGRGNSHSVKKMGKEWDYPPGSTAVPAAGVRWSCSRRMWMMLSVSGKSSHENWEEES